MHTKGKGVLQTRSHLNSKKAFKWDLNLPSSFALLLNFLSELGIVPSFVSFRIALCFSALCRSLTCHILACR